MDGLGKKRKRSEDEDEEISHSGVSFGQGIRRNDAKSKDFGTYGAEYKAKVVSCEELLASVLNVLCSYFSLLKVM